jgi:hypothetical protein
MKKLTLLVIIAILFSSCKKEDPNVKYCWECYNVPTVAAGWVDYGCYTESQLYSIDLTDQFGTSFNYSMKKNCRKK